MKVKLGKVVYEPRVWIRQIQTTEQMHSPSQNLWDKPTIRAAQRTPMLMMLYPSSPLPLCLTAASAIHLLALGF